MCEIFLELIVQPSLWGQPPPPLDSFFSHMEVGGVGSKSHNEQDDRRRQATGSP
jgi:hypothetical protein